MTEFREEHQRPYEYGSGRFAAALAVMLIIWSISIMLFEILSVRFILIFFVTSVLLIKGSIWTKPFYSFVPMSIFGGYLKDRMTMPGITYLLWPFYFVKKGDEVYTGKRSIERSISILSKTDTSAKDEKNGENFGGIEVFAPITIIAQTINPFKVKSFEGGENGIDNYMIDNLIEKPARRLGKTTSWQKLIFGEVDALEKGNISIRENSTFLEDEMTKELKNLIGYENGDNVIGSLGQEIIAINAGDIQLPENFRKKLQKIEEEKVERISEIQDSKTLFASAKEAIKDADESVNLKEALNQINARNGNMTRTENINTTNASKEVLDVVKEVGKSLSDSILTSMNKWFESKKTDS